MFIFIQVLKDHTKMNKTKRSVAVAIAVFTGSCDTVWFVDCINLYSAELVLDLLLLSEDRLNMLYLWYGSIPVAGVL